MRNIGTYYAYELSTIRSKVKLLVLILNRYYILNKITILDKFQKEKERPHFIIDIETKQYIAEDL